MRTYPVELCLEGRAVVVVGGGSVAARKVRGLIGAGARVTVVSPRYGEELAVEPAIVRVQRIYGMEDLQGAAVVFACTDDPALNARIAADALAAGIPCNVADDPERSSFLVPAVLRQGDFTVAVGTGGASPTLAATVRDELASRYGPVYAILAEELAAARREVLARTPDSVVRRRILETLCTSCSLKLLEQRGRQAWRGWLHRVIEHRLADRAGEPPTETEF